MILLLFIHRQRINRAILITLSMENCKFPKKKKQRMNVQTLKRRPTIEIKKKKRALRKIIPSNFVLKIFSYIKREMNFSILGRK